MRFIAEINKNMWNLCTIIKYKGSEFRVCKLTVTFTDTNQIQECQLKVIFKEQYK